MNSLHKIKKNYEFKKIYNEGKYFAEKYLVMYILKNKDDINKVGFSVSKKVGGSVVRNRVKRLLKESYRSFNGKLNLGYNIIFTARVGSAGADFRSIEGNMRSAIRRARLFKDGD